MKLSDNTRRFVHIIGKIPMFEGLNPVQAVEILKICTPRALANKEPVCLHSTDPTEMFVLLSGKLAVFAPEGTLLTHLSPITTVGEMGLFTNQPRTATVVAIESSSVFQINRTKLNILIKKHPEIGFKIYHNIIYTLSHRLEQNNNRLVVTQQELESLRTQVPLRLAISAA